MARTTYGEILRIPAVRRMLWVSLACRVPMAAVSVVLVVHVTGRLHHSYAMAGLLVTAETIGAALSGPWRGRRLDRIGLRATVLPSIVVMGVAWAIAPWVSYWPLLALAFVGALMMIPSFSVVRLVLIHAVPESDRKTVLALDSLATEAAFVIGPIIGVWLATTIDTRFALLVIQAAFVIGGLILWIDNPTLGPGDSDSGQRHALREWVSAPFLGVLLVGFAAVFVLTAGDIVTVAAMREMDATKLTGMVLALWAAGSAVGALIYGAAKRRIRSYWLLLALGLSTIPVALAHSPWQIAALLFVSGLFCAPTISATLEDLTHAVPAAVRGEAMGWHGSALTVGSSFGGPIIGLAVDHSGWPSGFVVAGVGGVLIAAVALVLLQLRRRRLTPAA